MKNFFNRLAAAVTCKAMAAKETITDLKNDQRGLSGIVVAILLILVAVLAVVLVWTFLGDYLQDVFDRILAADTI